MKFKEIKPGMVIHCPKEEDARALLEHLENLGYGCHSNIIDWVDDDTCYVINTINKWVIRSNKKLYAENDITEFSDLIKSEPERQIVSMNTLTEEYAVTRSSRIQPKSEDWTEEPPIIWTRCREDWFDGDTKYTNVEPWTRNGWHKAQDEAILDLTNLGESIINAINSTQKPMTAVEALGWLRNYDHDKFYKAFGQSFGGLGNLIVDWEPEAIVRAITAYEAAKAPEEILIHKKDVLTTACQKIEWLNEHRSPDLLTEIFGTPNFDTILDKFTTGDFIKRIEKYEAAKPKLVEVEWVQLCRVIQTKDDGTKKVVYEQNLKPETPFDEDPDLKEQTEAILKKYISGHEGRYIAVIEEICLVKEDEA